MTWAAKQHPVEALAEWAAPAVLAAGCGWSVRLAFLPPAVIAAAAIIAFAGGVTVMRIAGRRQITINRFEPVAIDASDLDELLLEAKDEVLLLDDPLVQVAPDSRVVRLFDRQEPTPGELVERIADFLGDGRRPPPEAAVPVDASASLHAALANIRASLR
jgi:hypothetical protein